MEPLKSDTPTDDESRLEDDIVDPAPVELEEEAAESTSASGLRFIVMALVVAACLAIFHLTPLKDYATNVFAWKDKIQATGVWAPLAFLGISSGLIAVGLPRLLFCALGGMLFGFLDGFLLALFASLFGSYATFIFARWGGREWVRKRIAQDGKMHKLLKHPSLFSVFLVRQLPIAGVVPNLVLGVTHVRHRVFLLGSFLGYLPSAAWVALIGSGIGKQSLAHAMGQITLAMLGLGGVSTLAWYLRRRLSGAAR